MYSVYKVSARDCRENSIRRIFVSTSYLNYMSTGPKQGGALSHVKLNLMATYRLHLPASRNSALVVKKCELFFSAANREHHFFT